MNTMTPILESAEIHRGDNTHHHDHDTLPVSFKPMNKIVSKPTNPILGDEELLVSAIVTLLLYKS
jgi:hypothetical protein